MSNFLQAFRKLFASPILPSAAAALLAWTLYSWYDVRSELASVNASTARLEELGPAIDSSTILIAGFDSLLCARNLPAEQHEAVRLGWITLVLKGYITTRDRVDPDAELGHLDTVISHYRRLNSEMVAYLALVEGSPGTPMSQADLVRAWEMIVSDDIAFEKNML